MGIYVNERIGFIRTDWQQDKTVFREVLPEQKQIHPNCDDQVDAPGVRDTTAKFLREKVQYLVYLRMGPKGPGAHARKRAGTSEQPPSPVGWKMQAIGNKKQDGFTRPFFRIGVE